MTYDELNSTLPAEVVSSEQFGSIMTMFGEMDIEIVDAPEGERIRKARDSEEANEEAEDAEVEAGAGAGEENEKEEKEEKEIDLTPGALSRTDDPVRLYLKEMGSVALLSREGEIEIAKRIEEGKKDIASVIYGMPMTIEFVLALYDQLKNGTIDVREIVPIVETEEEFEEETNPAGLRRAAGEDARRAEFRPENLDLAQESLRSGSACQQRSCEAEED